MGVRRFMREVVTQWRSLSMEVRSVRSMLEEVLSNWERYTSTVASLQAWLEDAEEALSEPENVKQSTKQKVISMETQYKLAACSAQLLVKDAPQDEAARVMATMAKAKTQLSKVGYDFFGQLDQRVLSVFLKACDELTDILPQEEQQSLQETVRRLHKHWKDLQTEVPSHLLRLKVDAERSRVALILQDCRAELEREIQALSDTCTSERVIKEHRRGQARHLRETAMTSHHQDQIDAAVRVQEGSAMFQYEELRDEVHGALEEVLRARKETEEPTSRILNAENLEEAKQLYLIHQLGPKNQGLLLQQAQSSREMEHEAELQKNASLTETLIQKESSLLHRSTPEAEQQLQAWTEDCLQLFNESQRLVLVSKECLTKLKTFLVKREAASKALRHLNEAVEGRGSWDHSKAEALHRGIVDVAKDIARLEAEAVGLDGLLSKAHLHLCVSESTRSKNISDPQGRTSCRGLAVDLMMALEEVQRAVGWRQSEADALGALWCSFRERKEEVMMNLNKIEDDARREEAKECSVQAFQNRLRFFVQLEDELQSLQHSQQWLEEKGNQLAQRDSELATEALREVALVKATWENLKTMITNR
ncbi:hypothetical protein XENOCAPTIV_000082 [Xenoophorus captivus]|uniref:Nesprin-1 spectrin repeats region domain-containing protein n=1 Tax=Xenoophorus captivus TaxID=1517983 RepID=A0ABV0RCZ5_9TELE